MSIQEFHKLLGSKNVETAWLAALRRLTQLDSFNSEIPLPEWPTWPEATEPSPDPALSPQ